MTGPTPGNPLPPAKIPQSGHGMPSPDGGLPAPANLWRSRFRLAHQVLSAHWQTALAYRGMLIIWGFRFMLIPTVLMMAWLSVDRYPETLYKPEDFVLYYLMMPIIMNLSDAWTVHSFPEQIRNGTLNRLLLQPLHPLWQDIAQHFTHKIIQTVYFLPLLFLLWLGVRHHLQNLTVSRVVLVLFLYALLQAIALRYLMGLVLAMTGFWIEHVETLNLVVNAGLWALLGGMIVPVETLPRGVRLFTDLLPYRYTLSFPIEVFRGHLSTSDFLQGVAVAMAWVALCLVITRRLWRRGLAVYSAYGG